MIPEPVNLDAKLAAIQDYWNPRVVGELNGQQVRLAKLRGDFIWHHHENEDELFLVLDGVLDVEERDGKVTLHPGELYVVPRGKEHRVVPHGHVKLLLFEPDGIEHTGKARAEITLDRYERLET